MQVEYESDEDGDVVFQEGERYIKKIYEIEYHDEDDEEEDGDVVFSGWGKIKKVQRWGEEGAGWLD